MSTYLCEWLYILEAYREHMGDLNSEKGAAEGLWD